MVRRVSGGPRLRAALTTCAASALPCAAAAAPPAGLLAAVQVAQWPFELNWAHLPEAPAHLFLEVGANGLCLERDDLGPLLADGPGGFLITFEPLLDKYSALLARHAANKLHHVRLGLQHRRGMALPYAVDECEPGATRTFQVAEVDGCSSLREFDEGFSSGWRSGVQWHPWVVKSCALTRERRTVPCVSLGDVVGFWLGGRRVARLKIDAQGSDLDVVRSLGPFADRVLFVRMEVVNDGAARLYTGAPGCRAIVARMRRLGFMPADHRLDRGPCNISFDATGQMTKQDAEFDLDFVRKEIRPLWRGFHAAYPGREQDNNVVCDVFAAAGACGAPYCGSHRLGFHVNRTGGCEGRMLDTISFDPVAAVGMIVLYVSDACLPHVRVARAPGRSPGTVFGHLRGVLRVTVDQGAVDAPNGCVPQLRKQPRAHGFLIAARFKAGGGGSTAIGVLLPGLLAMPSNASDAALSDLLMVASSAGVASFVWPGPCRPRGLLRRHRRARRLLRRIRRSVRVSRQGSPVVRPHGLCQFGAA